MNMFKNLIYEYEDDNVDVLLEVLSDCKFLNRKFYRGTNNTVHSYERERVRKDRRPRDSSVAANEILNFKSAGKDFPLRSKSAFFTEDGGLSFNYGRNSYRCFVPKEANVVFFPYDTNSYFTDIDYTLLILQYAFNGRWINQFQFDLFDKYQMLIRVMIYLHKKKDIVYDGLTILKTLSKSKQSIVAECKQYLKETESRMLHSSVTSKQVYLNHCREDSKETATVFAILQLLNDERYFRVATKHPAANIKYGEVIAECDYFYTFNIGYLKHVIDANVSMWPELKKLM